MKILQFIFQNIIPKKKIPLFKAGLSSVHIINIRSDMVAVIIRFLFTKDGILNLLQA